MVKVQGMRMINYIVVGRDRGVTLSVLQAVRSFTDAGCMVVGTRENRGLRWSSLCDKQATIRFDGAHDEAFVRLVDDLARNNRHLVLIPADCDAVRMVNRVSKRLLVNIAPIPDTPTMTMLADRWQFQQLCRRNGLPVPASRLIGGDVRPDFSALATALGLPFIVQPVLHQPSCASVLVRSRRDLLRLPARPDLMAQQIVSGIEVSISLLADRGQPTALAIAGFAQQSTRYQAALEVLATRLCQATAFSGLMRLRARLDLVTGAAVLTDCVPHCWPELTAPILAGLNLVAESVHPSPTGRALPRIGQAQAALGHPLAPARWQRLTAPDEGGRLLRAMSLDLYSLSLSTAGLMRGAWQKAGRRPAQQQDKSQSVARQQDATAG